MSSGLLCFFHDDSDANIVSSEKFIGIHVWKVAVMALFKDFFKDSGQVMELSTCFRSCSDIVDETYGKLLLKLDL